MNGVSDPAAAYPTLCTEITHPSGFTDKIVFTTNPDTQVSVGIKRTVPYFFGKMIGLTTANVAAKATAEINPPGSVPSGLFPVGLQCASPGSLSNLTEGSTTGVVFGQKFVGSVGASGNWQWVDVGQGNGASGLGSVLANGASGSFSIGDTIGTFVILFVAIQMAAIGREYMALGELNYQVTRWATNQVNNDQTKVAVSPQCADIANLISGATVNAQYKYVSTKSPFATGYMGEVGYGTGQTVCGSPPTGGNGLAMSCPNATSAVCSGLRPAGTAVQITLTMDTSQIIFLSTSKTSPNFLGIPFPKTSEQTMLTQ